MAPLTPLLAVQLAHQGGWDEILMVAGPILIFALLLRSANRRAARLETERGAAQDADDVGVEPLGGPAPRNERRGPV